MNGMEQWNSGTMEQWNNGTVEQWNNGTVEQWNSGTTVEQWERDGGYAYPRLGCLFIVVLHGG
jgi:hypothetical protein